MMRWVVTGPTGAGKSALTRRLAARGAEVLDGDLLGHEVLRDPAVIRKIKQTFGSQFIIGGEVDRPGLGQLVFADGEALLRLNGITHGPLSELMTRSLDELAATGDHSLAVLEAAVYFLLPTPPSMDLVILVTAEAGVRVERLVSAGLKPEMARNRIARQRAMEPAFTKADVVINNTGSLTDLERIVHRLLAEHLPPSAQ
ncbi:MAG: dephospho-CoA kinase [Gemmatimonadales bacterium]|nr:dephospho-CoA kinase [Gemmatimonadales bacterium]